VTVYYRQAANDDVARQFRYYLVTMKIPEVAIRFREAVRNTVQSSRQLFAGAGTNIRDHVGRNVAELIENFEVRVDRRTGDLFSRVWSFTGPVPTRDTAWSIAFRCRRCAKKGRPKF
jgi:hypothetical protein